MCEYISWIEYEGKNYFITETDLQTKEGRKLLKQYNNNIYHKDVVGHGFIRAYYPELKIMGQNKECTDFSSPKNFPHEIVKQIKAGNMKFAIISDLLDRPAWAEYEKIKGTARAEYEKIKGPAWAEYKKIEGPALAEYEKIEGTAWAEYKKIEGTAFWKLFKIKKNRAKEWK